ncbi:hypothetical protein N9L47_05405 [Rhodobacteraceae bacterium]|nr:hypothetical protein [Paracoccaceae bacterium]
MLMTLIFGIAAGWGAGFADDDVQRLMVKVLKADAQTINPIEIRSISLAAVVLLAALLSWIIASPNAVTLALGVFLGVLLPRLRDMVKAARAPDYDA